MKRFQTTFAVTNHWPADKAEDSKREIVLVAARAKAAISHIEIALLR